MKKNTQHFFARFMKFYFDFIGELECLPIFHFKTNYTDFILKKTYVSKGTKNYLEGNYEFICFRIEEQNEYVLQFNFNEDEFHVCKSFDNIDDIRFTDFEFEKFRDYLTLEKDSTLKKYIEEMKKI